jgi:hypothetical protein
MECISRSDFMSSAATNAAPLTRWAVARNCSRLSVTPATMNGAGAPNATEVHTGEHGMVGSTPLHHHRSRLTRPWPASSSARPPLRASADLNEAGRRGHATRADEEEHVEARWRDVAVGGATRDDAIGGSGDDRQPDVPLLRVCLMGDGDGGEQHHARNVSGVGCVDPSRAASFAITQANDVASRRASPLLERRCSRSR